MTKFRVTEAFYSLQGEGKYTGVPSVFLRLFGCNFQCQGFGMPRGQLSQERDNIDPNQYKDLNDLPLVTTGCDSYVSWDPRFKKFSKWYSAEDLALEMTDLIPGQHWMNTHLVITGGEPLLGWQKGFQHLLMEKPLKTLHNITFETNGTQPLDINFKNFLFDEFRNMVTFSVSAKLPCSGHSFEEAIKPDIVRHYQDVGDVYLKFVVATEQDVADATLAVEHYKAAGVHCPVYLMPVGGVDEVYQLNKTQVAELALKYGYRFSDRLHVSLFGNKWAT